MIIEWYIPDPNGMTSLGPYDTSYIAELIESGKLRTDDFICAPSISGEKWQRVYRYDQFKSFLPKIPICPPPRIFSKGIYSEKESGEISNKKPIFDISHFSCSLNAEIVLHDNFTVKLGKAIELREHSIIVELDPQFSAVKGDEYFLTIFNCPTLATFTCQTVLIDIKLEGDFKSAELYFTRLNPFNKKAIAQLLSLSHVEGQELRA